MSDENKIPIDRAKVLCDEIYQQNQKHKLSWKTWMCWGCRKFSKTLEERCWHNAKGGTNRGCVQINERFDKK